MKQTAIAPANIAFIKYWGKADDALRLPLNSSISLNLSGASTETTVEFDKALKKDDVKILDGEFSDKEIDRVVKGLDRIRERARVISYARVVTKNTFPKGAGSAASASGFAALTVAGFAALGVSLSEKELTIVSRMGSGSACRSIPDGFVEWIKGDSSETSFAYSLHGHDYWDVRDALIIIDSSMKKISTTDGMETIGTSPYLSDRLTALPRRIERCKKALDEKNFKALGEVTEEDCVDMHKVMQSQVPPVVYWRDETIAIMNAVRKWRDEGLTVYFTIDAGPNVHLVYEGKDESIVREKIATLTGVQTVIYNKSAAGAHIVDTHLY